MSEPETDQPGDEFATEVSDVTPRGPARPATTGASGATAVGARLRTWRTAGVAALVILALACVLATFPVVRADVRRWLAGPPSAPVIAPASDTLYLLPNPPGVATTLDGHHLYGSHTVESAQPLRLMPGRHIFTWQGAPFLAQRCVISAPHVQSDTCPLAAYTRQGPHESTPVILTIEESFYTLDNTSALQLRKALQVALDASEQSVPLRTGEVYYSAAPGFFGQMTSATQPLTARLHFDLLTQLIPPEPCEVARDVQPCRFLGQNCAALCTLPSQDVAGARPRDEWNVAAMVGASWEYQTPDGVSISAPVNELNLGFALAFFHVRWAGGQWSAQAVFGHASGIAIADDTMCLPARGWLFQGPTHQLFLRPARYSARYSASADPTDGCVAEIVDHQASSSAAGSASNPARFLARFGAIVAVNDAALALWPGLPRADDAERALAQRLSQ